MARQPRELVHLARRLVSVLRASRGTVEEDAWVRARLPYELYTLWRSQGLADRRHSVAVARAVTAEASRAAPAWVVQAALLHDVGKTGCGGVVVRVVASSLELLGVRHAPGAVGRYLTYPARGAALLRAAGAPAEVADWAAQHHETPSQWTVPPTWGHRLLSADRAS